MKTNLLALIYPAISRLKTIIGVAMLSVTLALLMNSLQAQDSNPVPLSPSTCPATTYTIGGWGGGNNNTTTSGPVRALFENWDTSPFANNGLVIGCGDRKLVLTSAQAVLEFLPSGSTTSILPLKDVNGNYLTNPGPSYDNVFAAQLVAVTLGVGYDLGGTNLASHVIMSGPFAGNTVGDFLAAANEAIGGCTISNPRFQGRVLTDFNNQADIINRSYDNGISTGTVVCNPCNLEASFKAGSISCYGGTTTVNVMASGGTEPYTGVGSFTVSAGAFSFEVVDARGCKSTVSGVISQPSQLTAQSSVSEAIDCNGGKASITISATGGVAPYTGVGIFEVFAGSHSFTVTDINGCEATTTIIVTEPTLQTAASSATEIKCFGGNSIVTVSASGGTAPYSGTGEFTVQAGEHTFVVTDANGCETTTTITISQPTAVSVSATMTKVTGFECGDGTITVTASGGTGNYTYSINGSSYQTSNVFTGLAEGTYTVWAKDANECPASVSIKVVAEVCLSTTVTQGGWGASCSGGNWGCYLITNWSKTGGSITIGSNNNFLVLTSALAVTNFLPSSGTPRALPVGTMTNPTEKSYKNTLAGQAVALTINLKMFGSLGDLIITSGTFRGTSVSQMLEIANMVLGGSLAYSPTEVNTALDNINRNFDNGTVNLGFLACPCIKPSTVVANGRDGGPSDVLPTPGFEGIRMYVYPNPFIDRATFEFSVEEESYVSLNVYSSSGTKVQTLFEGTAEANRPYTAEFIPQSNGLYIYRLVTEQGVVTGKLIQSNR